MLHNFVGEILNQTNFKDTFTFVNTVLKHIRVFKFRQYYEGMYFNEIRQIPSYTVIRWGSAAALLKFIVEFYSDIAVSLA